MRQQARKKCCRCGEVKTIDNFGRKWFGRGRFPSCNDCARKAMGASPDELLPIAVEKAIQEAQKILKGDD